MSKKRSRASRETVSTGANVERGGGALLDRQNERSPESALFEPQGVPGELAQEHNSPSEL